MIDKMRRHVCAGIAALALAACAVDVPVQTLPEITFSHLPTLGLDVAEVTVASEFAGMGAPSHIEHLMPTSPETALRRWADDRLEAKGIGQVARFTIVDAAVTEAPLKVDSGFVGAFKTEQAVRYNASAAATLEIVDERGFRRAFVNARVSRSRTLGENASINDRERMWFDLVEALMADFDAEMERNIRAHAGAYVM